MTDQRKICDVWLAPEDCRLAPASNADEVLTALAQQHPRQLFDEYRNVAIDGVVLVRELARDTNLWFIGDIHGDLLALDTALRYIGNSARLVFLGDLFDDGIHGAEVVLRVAELLIQHPGRAVVLAGNHDEGLQFTAGKFHSAVEPCEFAAWLNAHAGQRLGQAVIQWFQLAPRALILPDGLLATHGGFPLRDLWPTIQSPADLNSPRCLQDFVWTRASETARLKIPNRTSKGCQFGFEDFSGFCAVATQVLGTPVRRMVRGHDHVADRFLFYDRYAPNPVLTINTLSHRLKREILGPYERTACVARWVPGELPEVHRLHIPAETLHALYPEPVAVADE